jgi:hypothetical protein
VRGVPERLERFLFPGWTPEMRRVPEALLQRLTRGPLSRPFVFVLCKAGCTLSPRFATRFAGSSLQPRGFPSHGSTVVGPMGMLPPNEEEERDYSEQVSITLRLRPSSLYVTGAVQRAR